MKPLLNAQPDPGVHFDLQLFETAKRRAAALRKAAVDEVVRGAIRSPRALLQALWQRWAGKETATCRS